MALAQSLLRSGRGVNGSALFTDGMAAAADPMFLSDRAYRLAFNLVNRGGIVRTRPGYRSVFELTSGKLQGLAYFRPIAAEAYLVFAVAGKVYASRYPFSSYDELPNIQFNPYAKQVYFESAIKSAQLNADGTISTIEPKRVLMMQDGAYTRPAYWDGASSGHLDPSQAAEAEATIEDVTVGDVTTTGVVTRATVTFQGDEYDAAPRVVFSAPSDVTGRRATGTAILLDRKLIAIQVTDGGAGYLTAPTIVFADPSVDSSDPAYGMSDKYQTPLGGPMIWSGDRLWVARGNKLFASDINDPLSFTESIYFAEGGFFQFNENIVGLAEIPSLSSPSIAIFTGTTTSAIQSGIRDRSTWKQTPNFQQPIFPGVGCVSPRSIVKPYGELWWMTPAGFVSFNSAAQAASSSKLSIQDTAMLVSKANLSPDLSGTAAGTYENFIVLSVPYADKLNQHTWVLDQAVLSEVGSSSSTSWAGIWTGTRPVEWASGIFNNSPRSFFISVDYDGTNRLWEAFSSERTDNGNPISWAFETKSHNDFGAQATGLDLKRFVFGEVTLTDVVGETDLSVYWAGTRGKYKKIADWHLVSTKGSLEADTAFTSVASNLPQTRVLRTPEIKTDANATCSSLGVESKRGDWMDTAFSLLIEGSGQAAIRSYRIFVDPEQEMGTGEAALTEQGPRVVQGAICT